MRLHEAINKAGEGGKIRRKNWSGSFIVPASETAELVTHPEGAGYRSVKGDLTADDWEVVAPEIQVGDTVQICGCGTGHRKVLLLTEKEAVVQGIEHHNTSLSIFYTHMLTFISRPEKPKEHVFKGIQVTTEDRHPVIVHAGTKNYPAVYSRLVNNGKTYTAVFTEEE